MADTPRIERERDFWDHEVPPLAQCLDEFHSGPDAHTSAMLDAIGDVWGLPVLDFACGAGVTSCWLAARGAQVTALDLSPVSIERCTSLAAALGLGDRVTPVVGELGHLEPAAYAGAVGRYALHHIDCAQVGPQLAARLRPGARAAFVETFDSNPFLRFARNHVIGHWGVPRYGTLDEQPLRTTDIDALRDAFGTVEIVVPRMSFLRLLDRQVLQHRSAAATRLIGAADDLLGRSDRLGFLSYHQVVICGPVGTGERPAR